MPFLHDKSGIFEKLTCLFNHKVSNFEHSMRRQSMFMLSFIKNPTIMVFHSS